MLEGKSFEKGSATRFASLMKNELNQLVGQMHVRISFAQLPQYRHSNMHSLLRWE
jgi:hypothetical protein